jgi:hypothetical protein
MRIKFDVSALRQTRWYEYAVPFFFGGAVTLMAGWIAKRYGPVVGGLFLAFPAIFPASATLVQKHETEKKQKAGIIDNRRGRKAAALDARGAALGCVALACFAGVVWWALPTWNAAVSLAAAIASWLVIALLAWRLNRLLP